ncbi:putative dehydrogenase [Paenibacillus sp. PvR052]|nr:putative dehydrogenase [Paenibacillus sp. PvP091]MBP1172186.1 putative dehydrogenase [Paenibacillus sp. PvR098]MBP2438567.1 putative dehydrogenase [Paenibacillus sp. PvP052]
MKQVRVGMIGYKFMGKAHSHAYRDLPMFFPKTARPVMKAICGRDAEGVAQAVGVKHMIGFNYRFAPAVQLAKKLIEDGRLGKIYHFRAWFGFCRIRSWIRISLWYGGCKKRLPSPVRTAIWVRT